MVMSRKARLTVLRDKLESVSYCPSSIFNIFDPSEEDFELIVKSESGDVAALDELCEKLYGIYGVEKEENDALLYFLTKGLEAKSPLCAKLLIKYIERYNTHFDLLKGAIETLGSADDGMIRDISSARLKAIIAAPSKECDFTLLKENVLSSDTPHRGYLLLYIAGKSFEYTGAFDKERARTIADELSLGGLLDLTLFGGSMEKLTECDTDALKLAIGLFDMYEWSDFWLRAAYEQSMLFREGDMTQYAHDILKAISHRPDYPKKELHEFAVKKYIFANGLGYTEEELEVLERSCQFNGLSTDDELDALIRDAVYYTCTREKCGASSLSYDAEIQHERNRYTLTMTLENHKKRASRHQWNAVIAIRTDEDNPPVIEPLEIVDRLAEISRNGITLKKEKKASQVLCAGEIRIGDRISPLELDLILDISYVSATKCTHCAFKIERYRRQGEYLLIQTDISLYANN